MDHVQQDLTPGSVPKKLMRFALPLLDANLLQSLYSIVDLLVVGQMVGEVGLAAISNASMIRFVIHSICIGVTMGGTVLVAQYRGAKDEQGQKDQDQKGSFDFQATLLVNCVDFSFSIPLVLFSIIGRTAKG